MGPVLIDPRRDRRRRRSGLVPAPRLTDDRCHELAGHVPEDVARLRCRGDCRRPVRPPTTRAAGRRSDPAPMGHRRARPRAGPPPPRRTAARATTAAPRASAPRCRRAARRSGRTCCSTGRTARARASTAPHSSDGDHGSEREPGPSRLPPVRRPPEQQRDRAGGQHQRDRPPQRVPQRQREVAVDGVGDRAPEGERGERDQREQAGRERQPEARARTCDRSSGRARRRRSGSVRVRADRARSMPVTSAPTTPRTSAVDRSGRAGLVRLHDRLRQDLAGRARGGGLQRPHDQLADLPLAQHAREADQGDQRLDRDERDEVGERARVAGAVGEPEPAERVGEEPASAGAPRGSPTRRRR